MGAVDQSPPALERRVAPDLAQPRPRRRRPASAWVLMLLAGVVAALAAYVVVRDDSTYYLAATAARELPAGATLSADALSFTELRVAEEVAATVLLRDHLPELEGWVLAHAVPAGGLISLEAVRAPSAPSLLRAMSLPVPAERAVAGAIGRGDRVDVIEVRDDTATYVAVGIEVLAVGVPASGPVAGTAAGGHTLTVAVDDETALVLARAVEHGAVHVVRATGSAPATLGGAVTTDDPRPGRLVEPGDQRLDGATDAEQPEDDADPPDDG